MNSKKPPKPAAPPRTTVAVITLILVALAGAVWFAKTSRQQQPHKPERAATPSPKNPFAGYATSPTCKSCHEEAYALWEKSHHALAERAVNLVGADGRAFEPPQTIHHGTQTSTASATNGQPSLTTQGPLATNQAFALTRVIGADPLRQFLVPAPGGRWQVTELAFDPHRGDWFDVYGAEDRQVGEWGHWTGRGMNWNSMCADCHNTRLQKNYDAASDTFRTASAEMGVGCEACHGPMADHNAWQAKHPNQAGDPTIKKISRQQMFSTCGQCHARRGELTGNFSPGASFFDHYQLAIPDETEFFYADGQIHEEDYEFTAFLGSKMHAAGVRCVDCHEPHSVKTRIASNLLCMVCHGALTNTAPRIDLATHSHHKLDERGDACVECHMPITTYMQRHPRHDHGFTIPDPRLTEQFGIPNACNRCHTNQTTAWSLEALAKWYGPRTNNAVLARTETIVKARNGDAASVPALVKMTSTETNSFWRAVAVRLLREWCADTNATAALLRSLNDTNELVRAGAAHSLEPLAQVGLAPVREALTARLADAVRCVRVEAAWALRTELDTNSVAGADLLGELRQTADQPGGALRLGILAMDRGDLEDAMTQFRRVADWDAHSSPAHHALAVALSMTGQSAEAVTELESAVRLAPREAEYRYKLGLALNEVGRLNEACTALGEAVKLEPRFSRAWYNLGLAQSALKQDELALTSLLRAESLDAGAADIPYARATVLARLGRVADARKAAARALELDANFSAARGLLNSLDR